MFIIYYNVDTITLLYMIFAIVYFKCLKNKPI